MMDKKPKSKNDNPKAEGIGKVQKTKVKKKVLKKKRMTQVLKDKAIEENNGSIPRLTLSEVKQSSWPTTSADGNNPKPLTQAKTSSQPHAPQDPAMQTQRNPPKSSSNQSAPAMSVLKTSGSVPKMNGNTDVVEDGPSSGKHKRKRGSKKTHDGISNWASLCSKLKIDPNRKKEQAKAQEKTNEEEKPSEPTRSKPEIWFDNVDKLLIERDPSQDTSLPFGEKQGPADDRLVKPDSFTGVTQCVAMDCEMVGVGPSGEESVLARVSLVNHFGVCLYDKFVLPREKVTDYRTHVSGVTRENLKTGEEFTKVQKEVSDIIRGKILIGHALQNDLKVLFLTHPHKMIRDTSKYKPFRQLFKGSNPSLKKLADRVLGVTVQEGQHSSVQDAQATMRLYTMHRQRWEKELRQTWKQDKKNLKKKAKKKLTKS
ncbi:hypothetical protein EGW08_021401 [Elysia chlorotica]|uniref:RNA exonuclease 4 n=1 Tax=Elysia chlorotica TaxID=188477 RepID=A0A433SNN2_ELYCH|nr:hypothetical protein EGW08_021401 [Elysia chlorotica]